MLRLASIQKKLKLIASLSGLCLFLALSACSRNESSNNTSNISPTRLSSANQSNEGGWESSGGDGVACFDSAENANQAKQELKITGFMSHLTRQKIKSVVTLETWDFLQKQTYENSNIIYLSEYIKSKNFNLNPQLEKLQNQDQIFRTVLNNLKPYVPLFVLRLEMVEGIAPLKMWTNSTQIPQIDDSTPIRSLVENSSCVLIQLADRRTHSKDGKLPKTEIIYDQELFEKHLSKIDQALLIMHEYLYLIGKEGNHKNSDEIRKINAFMFSDNAFNFDKKLQYVSNRALALRQIIGFPFGDYMRFFKKEDIINKEKLSLQDSRYNAIITFMEKARQSLSACLEKEKYDLNNITEQKKIIRLCQNDIIEKHSLLWDSLTNEESYLFMTRFYFDQTSEINGASLGTPFQGTGLDFNSEILTVPGVDTKENIHQATYYCKLLDKKPAINFLSLQEKAKLYCQDKIGTKVTLLKNTPIKKKTLCDANERISIGTFDNVTSGSISTKLNKETGANFSEAFNGNITLLNSIDSKELRNIGFGNREYLSERVYRIKPFSKESFEEIIWLLKQKPNQDLIQPEPELFISLTILKDSKELIIHDPDLAIQELNQSSFDKVVGLDLKLNCDNQETNLPDEAWYYH